MILGHEKTLQQLLNYFQQNQATKKKYDHVD